MSSGDWPVRLVSDEVVVRPLSTRDARAWREVRRRNAQWLLPWDATPPPGADARPHSFPTLVRELRRQARQGRAFPFAVEADDEFVGQVTVSNVVRGSAQSASLGYWIDQSYAGRSIIPRAVALVIDHCLFTVGLHRMEIAIRPENSNSLRVVEKLGIPEVGYAPGYLHIDGDWRDHRLYAITREQAPEGLLARLTTG